MAHEQRKRGAAAPAEEPEAPTRAKRGRVSAPAPSQRDASAAKREKFDEGKAHRQEPEEVIDVDDEDDDDVDPKDADVVQMTQVYQTQLESFDTQAVITRISNEERDALVSEVMRLMLFSQYKDGAPVLRADVSKLLSSLSPARGLTGYIVAKAQIKFLEVFGYEMKELTRTVAKKTGAARHARTNAEPPKVYVLKSTLPTLARKKWVDKAIDLPERGFCMTVCALVQMSGGSINEDKLWGLLENMGCRKDDEAHPNLGDTKSALAKLIKKRYLIREKQVGATSDNGGDAYSLSLAERAIDEIGVDGVESFVSGIMRGAEGAEGADDVET